MAFADLNVAGGDLLESASVYSIYMDCVGMCLLQVSTPEENYDWEETSVASW